MRVGTGFRCTTGPSSSCSVVQVFVFMPGVMLGVSLWTRYGLVIVGATTTTTGRILVLALSQVVATPLVKDKSSNKARYQRQGYQYQQQGPATTSLALCSGR